MADNNMTTNNNSVNNSHKKSALFAMLHIFREYSDADHILTQADMAEHLVEKYGIHLERKAISRNIDALIELGMDIEKTSKGSYLRERLFEDSELYMLVDIVLGCNYIPLKYAQNLVERLSTLSSAEFQNKIKSISKHVYSGNEVLLRGIRKDVRETDRKFGHETDKKGEEESDKNTDRRTENMAVFFNIEQIHNAIDQKKKITYRFFKYDVNRKVKYGTEPWVVSPYRLLTKNQQYYLMASYLDDRCEPARYKITYQRVDHINNIKIMDEPITPVKQVAGFQNGINYRELYTSQPYMFADMPQEVVFKANVSIVDDIFEWFGKNVRIEKTENPEIIKITHKVSPGAMHYWALQYVNSVEVLSPLSLRERIRESLAKGLTKYQ